MEMEIVAKVKGGEDEGGMNCIEGFLPFCASSSQPTITVILIFILFKFIK